MDFLLNRRELIAAAGGVAIASSVIPDSAASQETTWRLVDDGGSGPTPRWDHHLAADGETGLLLVFGGRDVNGTALGDTWIYDLESGAWSQSEAAGPPPRFGSAIAEDRGRRRLYLFGGEDAGTFYSDTWRFDFKAMEWRIQDDGSAVGPSPRYGLAGSMDGDDNFVISHGFTFEGRFDDTWVFDTRNKTWIDRSPAVETRPLKRCLHEMVQDSASERLVLFGGCSSGFGPCPQGDLWSFDLATGAWTNITPASGPSARSNPAMVWDATNNRVLLLGGLADAGYVSDLWDGRFEGDMFVWTAIGSEGPSVRGSHDAIVLDQTMYVFGGRNNDGTLNDLWALSID